MNNKIGLANELKEIYEQNKILRAEQEQAEWD
jgi:hypothetical protein